MASSTRIAIVFVTTACAITATGNARADDESVPDAPEPPVIVFMPPPPEAAPPEPPPESRWSASPVWGFEGAVGTLFLRPVLEGLVFTGAGSSLGSAQRHSFRRSGRQLGIDTPLLWGADVSLQYIRRYFAVGLVGFIASDPKGGLMAYGGGINVAGSVPLGRAAVRVGGALGVRGFAIPMSGFENTTYVGDEKATTNAQIFFEPRVLAETSLKKGHPLFVGVYVGMQMLASPGPTAGLLVGLQTAPHSTLRP